MRDIWVNMSNPSPLLPVHLGHITHIPSWTATSKVTQHSDIVLRHRPVCYFASPQRFFLSRLFSAFPQALSLIFRMNYEMGSSADGDRSSSGDSSNHVLDIYPLSCYYFGSKDPLLLKDETLADRILRMKSKSLSLHYLVGHCFFFFLLLWGFLNFLFFLCSCPAILDMGRGLVWWQLFWLALCFFSLFSRRILCLIGYGVDTLSIDYFL